MQMTQLLLQEMEAEALTTRKMLLRVPNDKYDWKPHEKSLASGSWQHILQNCPAG